MYKFSYIICYRHQEERFKNLIKVINYLKNSFKEEIEIILVEQDTEQKIKDTSIFDKYIFTYSKRPFNRSWAFNVGGNHSSTNKIFFGDCDLIVPIDQMYESIELLDTHGCVSPYKSVIDLSPPESHEVNLNSWINIQRNSRPGINLTGGVVGFDKSEFIKISGWCEDFEGWGGEDDFQTWKVKTWIKHTEVSGNVYHLYHTRPHIDQNVYRKNLGILRSIGTKDPQDLLNWINESRSSIGNINKYKNN